MPSAIGGLGASGFRSTVLLLSGGVDSTVLFQYLIAKDLTIYPLFVNYGQRAFKREYASFRKACTRLSCKDARLVEIPAVSQLTRNQLTVPGPLESWFPMRNSLLIDIGAIQAHSLGCHMITIGLVRGPTFPDTSRAFLRKTSRLISTALGSRLLVNAPFIEINKPEVVKLGLDLGIPLGDTYSCYQGGALHCGHCQGCISRKAAFLAASRPHAASH